MSAAPTSKRHRHIRREPYPPESASRLISPPLESAFVETGDSALQCRDIRPAGGDCPDAVLAQAGVAAGRCRTNRAPSLRPSS